MMNDNKRKIAWLIIGGIFLLGVIGGSIGKNLRPEVKNTFWSNVSSQVDTYTEKTIQSGDSNKIVVIRVEGVLTDTVDNSTSSFVNSGGTTAEQIAQQVNQAQNDVDVKGIILQINSPGGTAVAGQTVMERIADFRNSGKKVYVAMREVAASAAYEIALPADRIFANQETETGSIGVIMELPNYTGLYGKLGVENIVIKSGAEKDLGNPSRPMTDSDKSILQSLVDESYNNFVANVAKWRKMDEAKVRSIGDGRVYSAAQAKELGLIDEIANLPAVIDYAKKDSGVGGATVVEYEVGPLGGLLSTIFQKVSLGSQLSNLLGQSDTQDSYQLMHIWKP